MINCTSIVGGTILFKRTPHRSEFEDQILKKAKKKGLNLKIAKKKGLNLRPVLLITILYPFFARGFLIRCSTTTYQHHSDLNFVCMGFNLLRGPSGFTRFYHVISQVQILVNFLKLMFIIFLSIFKFLKGVNARKILFYYFSND